MIDKPIIRHSFVFILLLCICSALSVFAAEVRPRYKDPSLPVEQRVEDLLARMTLTEKIDQLSGLGFDTKENQRLGIPVLKMTDGPVGVRWGTATAFPAAVGLAASWDPDLLERTARVIGLETRAKGRNYLLGPCVNIHRFPLGGRNFESYGEDPFLAARLATAFVKGIQSQGVLASVKHFACNNQEWERHKVDVGVSERALREIYLPAFKAAVQEGNVYTVMAAYNLLRGDHCSQSAYLLNDILKKEWGFDGFVVSDWRSVYSTVEAANAGLDLEMPYGEFFGAELSAAVKRGDVSAAVIDDKIRRLLRVRFRAGLFDRTDKEDPAVVGRREHKLLAAEAAEKSIVLLKNNEGVLPLNPATIKTLAVIGPNALDARVGGGGSSKVTPLACVSPLQGLQNALGRDVKIKYALGIAQRGDIHPLRPMFMTPLKPVHSGSNGLQAEYFSNLELKGEPVLTRLDPTIDFNWGYDAPHPALHRVDDRNTFSVRWTGKLLPPKSGIYKLNVINNDGIRIYLEDKLILDQWRKGLTTFKTVSVTMEAGKSYRLRIEYFFDGGISMVKFGWQLPDHDYIAEAVETARVSDAVIIFAGLYERFESEGQDRPRLELPNQDQLIAAVAAVNPRTVVVLNSGTPVRTDKWLHLTGALVQAWYPGQEGGDAVARVLLGKVNPSAKLPFSYINDYSQSPAFKGYKEKSLKSNYDEGIYVGYRYLDHHGINPAFAFGHGLSYTVFEYRNIKAVSSGPEVQVRCDIKNSGGRTGREIVQLYVHPVQSSVSRPPQELKGFAEVSLAPGESRTVTIKLNDAAFAYYDEGAKSWKTEAGDYEIRVGASSRDIRLRTRIRR